MWTGTCLGLFNSISLDGLSQLRAWWPERCVSPRATEVGQSPRDVPFGPGPGIASMQGEPVSPADYFSASGDPLMWGSVWEGDWWENMCFPFRIPHC